MKRARRHPAGPGPAQLHIPPDYIHDVHTGLDGLGIRGTRAQSRISTMVMPSPPRSSGAMEKERTAGKSLRNRCTSRRNAPPPRPWMISTSPKIGQHGPVQKALQLPQGVVGPLSSQVQDDPRVPGNIGPRWTRDRAHWLRGCCRGNIRTSADVAGLAPTCSPRRYPPWPSPALESHSSSTAFLFQGSVLHLLSGLKLRRIRGLLLGRPLLLLFPGGYLLSGPGQLLHSLLVLQPPFPPVLEHFPGPSPHLLQQGDPIPLKTRGEFGPAFLESEPFPSPAFPVPAPWPRPVRLAVPTGRRCPIRPEA